VITAVIIIAAQSHDDFSLSLSRVAQVQWPKGKALPFTPKPIGALLKSRIGWSMRTWLNLD
jgi:hypothetical protein